MLTYNELTTALSVIDIDNITEGDKLTLREIGTQLGYDVPDCTCKDRFTDLLIKLRVWVKNHPDGFCHYDMTRGVVRKYKDGTNVYNLNLTDEKAEWLLENDEQAKNYLTKIIEEETNDSIEPVANSNVSEVEVLETERTVETVEAKPRRGRKKNE